MTPDPDCPTRTAGSCHNRRQQIEIELNTHTCICRAGVRRRNMRKSYLFVFLHPDLLIWSPESLRKSAGFMLTDINILQVELHNPSAGRATCMGWTRVNKILPCDDPTKGYVFMSYQKRNLTGFCVFSTAIPSAR